MSGPSLRAVTRGVVTALVLAVGATEADLEPLANDAFHDVCTPGNPRQATQEDILAIYKSLM